MEPADAVLAHLYRIGALDRGGAAPGELLAELRGLLREAEALSGVEHSTEPQTKNATEEEVVGRLRAALARDIIDA